MGRGMRVADADAIRGSRLRMLSVVWPTVTRMPHPISNNSSSINPVTKPHTKPQTNPELNLLLNLIVNLILKLIPDRTT
jgi:hypothetical protein